ncbi:MAG: SGNH/GDSL hydrolase family protein [Kiritimatiellae bacterium]|nr:SGNH/GDSL hydrolase family protein [Kiritimatiellia bacterium]
MRTLCGTILVAAGAAVAAGTPLAEYPGEVGENTGWKCVGSEEGKVVYIPFEGYYESKGGRIESPRFKLDGEIGKNRFYRLTFSAKCPVDGYWWVDFFDAEGNQLPDVNSRLYASDDWTPYDVMVPARPDAAFAQIAFVTKKGAQAKDVSMRQASVAAAAKWCNDLASTLPNLDTPETAGAWAKLPKTREKILSGKKVNIVFLGNSIVNDTWCGNVAALILDALPKADLRCFISVRGSTGCGYYHERGHFDEYVAKYEPDLVVIGGTSNYQGKGKGETLDMAEEWLVETIERCKAIGAEAVISTPPPSREFRADATPRPFDRSLTNPTEDEAYRWLYSCFEYNAAKRTGVQVWDLTTAPCDAISRSGKPLNWFKRDEVHNDDRGKQLIAQTLAAYFKAL